jgi:hypothetical protein
VRRRRKATGLSIIINSSGKTPYNRKGGERGIFEWKTQGVKNNGIDIS